MQTEYPFYEIKYELHTVKDIVETTQKTYQDNPVFRFKQDGAVAEKYKDEFLGDVKRTGFLFRSLFGRGAHIAVLGRTGYEWLCCFFGAMVSGNVAVPIDRELREEDILEQLYTADVACLLYDSSVERIAGVVETKAEGKIRCIAMQGGEENGLQKQLERADGYFEWEGEPREEDIAAIVFTSGTTGKGKGVMLTHGNLAWNGMNGSSYTYLTSRDSTMSILPVHHMLEITAGIVTPMLCGVTICINDSLKYMNRNLKLFRPQCMIVVPLVIETMYKNIWREIEKNGQKTKMRWAMRMVRVLYICRIDIRRRVFAPVLEQLGGNLRLLVGGGAYIAPELIKNFETWGINIVQGYGITECAPVIACNTDRYKKYASVGKIVNGCEVKIVDGEIWVRGPIVMKGYYKNPELTGEVMEDGWFKTGDMGYLDRERFLYLTGRKKNLIILSNGENVSPEELERDFLQDAAVREVVVYADDGVITAEIFPDGDYWGQDAGGKGDSGEPDSRKEEYFRNLMRRINQGRPAYKQVGRVKLRDAEFKKTTSRKIIRE